MQLLTNQETVGNAAFCGSSSSGVILSAIRHKDLDNLKGTILEGGFEKGNLMLPDIYYSKVDFFRRIFYLSRLGLDCRGCYNAVSLEKGGLRGLTQGPNDGSLAVPGLDP